MTKLFKRFETELNKCFTGEVNSDHESADDILKEIAVDTNLTLEEKLILINIYDRVEKCYNY